MTELTALGSLDGRQEKHSVRAQETVLGGAKGRREAVAALRAYGGQHVAVVRAACV